MTLEYLGLSGLATIHMHVLAKQFIIPHHCHTECIKHVDI